MSIPKKEGKIEDSPAVIRFLFRVFLLTIKLNQFVNLIALVKGNNSRMPREMRKFLAGRKKYFEWNEYK